MPQNIRLIKVLGTFCLPYPGHQVLCTVADLHLMSNLALEDMLSPRACLFQSLVKNNYSQGAMSCFVDINHPDSAQFQACGRGLQLSPQAEASLGPGCR